MKKKKMNIAFIIGIILLAVGGSLAIWGINRFREDDGIIFIIGFILMGISIFPLTISFGKNYWH